MDYFPLLSFLLYLTEHIHVAPIWVEFKINQRGCRVNMSTIGLPALPDWRSFSPCQQALQQAGYTKPDIFMVLVRKMDMMMWFGPFRVCSECVCDTAPPYACAVLHWAVCWVGRKVAFLRAGSWGPRWGFLWGFFFQSVRGDVQSVREAEGVIPFKTVPHVPLFWQFFYPPMDFLGME